MVTLGSWSGGQRGGEVCNGPKPAKDCPNRPKMVLNPLLVRAQRVRYTFHDKWRNVLGHGRPKKRPAVARVGKVAISGYRLEAAIPKIHPFQASENVDPSS